MNLRQSRIRDAVAALGAPTTLEVAERCQLSTSEALEELRALEKEQRIQAVGRRWVAPSRQLSPVVDPRHIELDKSPWGYGCWIVLALVAGLGLSLWMGLRQ